MTEAAPRKSLRVSILALGVACAALLILPAQICRAQICPEHVCPEQIGAAGATAEPASAPLQIQGSRFLLRGKPFQILSGELEYARIPRADWRDRLRKVRAMGLNTITVYVFWNLHETQPGVFDFSGQKDVAEFLREAQQEGLYVVLRPGPYVCAEWDLGGYPAWLLKQSQTPGSEIPAILLRSSQPEYLAAVRRWMNRLGQELAPLQASRGGPILAVQVENEYGSFHADQDGKTYLSQILKIVRDAGFGESLLYTADGGEELPGGSIPGLMAGIDFGTGDAQHELPLLQKFQPDAPIYIAEYWDGWFDHWGEQHHTTSTQVEVNEVRQAIQKGYSISLYMADGGTSFGWMNGANWDKGRYEPDVSSYDYDAPIDEAGRPTAKYFALRSMIAETTHRRPPPVPPSAPMLKGKKRTLKQSESLWSALPAPALDEAPRSMEELGQGYGDILYRTTIGPGIVTTNADTNAGDGAESRVLLKAGKVHSYARVYVDGQPQGVMDRRLGQRELWISAHTGQRLDLLVENSGRINFTARIRGERTGILGEVSLNGKLLQGWQIMPLPLDEPPHSGYAKHGCKLGPCFYRGSVRLSSVADTYLNTAALGKGVVWVNGHLLGRFWDVGPMGTLYLPGAWLHPGSNSVVVMDWNGENAARIRLEDHPIYLQPRNHTSRSQLPSN
ncbi:MAG: glycoside hydrolase family 35 protein [Acidobacteriaceae bacterium]